MASDDLYSVAVLIDELRHDDLPRRKNAIQNLGVIAAALGEERTRDELLPFLGSEVVDEEEELLICLADIIPTLVEHVGGPEYAHHLMPTLEELANKEEAIVRTKATSALCRIGRQMPLSMLKKQYASLIVRLSSHDWFPSRISATGLFPTLLYELYNESMKNRDESVNTMIDESLRAFHKLLVQDDTPMVRRAAANVVGDIAAALPNKTDEMLDFLTTVSRDEQDSVRVLAVGSTVALARHHNKKLSKGDGDEDGALKAAKADGLQRDKKNQNADKDQDLSKENQNADVIRVCSEVLQTCVGDKGWRVRYMVGDQIAEILEQLPHEEEIYHRILADAEGEVRAAAVAKLGEVVRVMSMKKDKEELKLFMQNLMPKLQDLAKDTTPVVRVSFAGTLLHTVPHLGEELTVEYIVKLCLELMRDDNCEVRLKLISTLSELHELVGTLSQSLLPVMKDLASDRAWRVRLAILDHTPLIAKFLGPEVFTESLWKSTTGWLGDPVYMVREGACENMGEITSVLGVEWAEKNILPEINPNLITHENYLLRVTAINCLAKLIGILPDANGNYHNSSSAKFDSGISPEKNPKLDTSNLTTFTVDNMCSLLIGCLNDPVANVRFNVCKAVSRVVPWINRRILREEVIPKIEGLSTDSDPDVRHFAAACLQVLKKDMMEMG